MSHNGYLFMRTLTMVDHRLLQELEAEVTHPLADYTPEKVEALYQQMQFQNKYTFPTDFCFNL